MQRRSTLEIKPAPSLQSAADDVALFAKRTQECAEALTATYDELRSAVVKLQELAPVETYALLPGAELNSLLVKELQRNAAAWCPKFLWGSHAIEAFGPHLAAIAKAIVERTTALKVAA